MGISPPIQAASLGMADSLILMVLALVVFGPKRLPQIGRQIGKLMYEFRKASNDFKYQMEEELRNAEDADRRKREEAERQRTLAETQQVLAQAQTAVTQAQTAAAQAQSAAQAAQSAAAAESASADEIYPDDPYYDALIAQPAAMTAPAETGLRVQPPSTGEQVPTSPPGRAPVADTAEASSAATQESLPAEAAAETNPAASESAPRHG